MSYNRLRSTHDESLHIAAQRILRMLEEEELAKRQRDPSRVERMPDPRTQTSPQQPGMREQVAYDGNSLLPMPQEDIDTDYFPVSTRQFRFPNLLDALAQFEGHSPDDPPFASIAEVPQASYLARLASRNRIYAPFQGDDTTGAATSGVQRVNGVAVPGVLPGPFIIPPVAIPGSKENQEWVRWATKMLRELGKLIGGGGRDCSEEWEYARQTCKDELAKPNPNPKITGGYTNPEACARGLVSEDCGGNKVEREPKKPRRRHWHFN